MIRHQLPPLPYSYNALQPWIDEQTMRLHHGYHHRKWVEELNAAQDRLVAAWQSGDAALIRHFQRLIALYQSEHALHGLFWETMGPNQGGLPRGDVADQIVQDFGTFGALKSRFSRVANSLETAGWVVLTWQPWHSQLAIVSGEGVGLQTEAGGTALLALDVWEHAYYLRYQHRRAEYVHNWWNTVNWAHVGERFSAASRSRLTGRAHARGRHAARPPADPDARPGASGTAAFVNARSADADHGH
ncbi:MAG: superoxide dismutase [Candidatus Binatia bacterium]